LAGNLGQVRLSVRACRAARANGLLGGAAGLTQVLDLAQHGLAVGGVVGQRRAERLLLLLRGPRRVVRLWLPRHARVVVRLRLCDRSRAGVVRGACEPHVSQSAIVPSVLFLCFYHFF
jgi:hypothetical protein